MLEYKAEREGKRVLRAGRFDPTSKRHYDCGYVYKELTLNDRQWRCPNCGKLVMRDFNGSVNIKEYALERYLKSLQTGVERTEEPVEPPGNRDDEAGKIGERAMPLSSSHRL
jgi:putative transposase